MHLYISLPPSMVDFISGFFTPHILISFHHILLYKQSDGSSQIDGQSGVGGGGGGGGGTAGVESEDKGTPKRLHVSNIPFRFRDPDLRQMFGVSEDKYLSENKIMSIKGAPLFNKTTFSSRYVRVVNSYFKIDVHYPPFFRLLYRMPVKSGAVEEMVDGKD